MKYIIYRQTKLFYKRLLVKKYSGKKNKLILY